MTLQMVATNGTHLCTLGEHALLEVLCGDGRHRGDLALQVVPVPVRLVVRPLLVSVRKRHTACHARVHALHGFNSAKQNHPDLSMVSLSLETNNQASTHPWLLFSLQ